MFRRYDGDLELSEGGSEDERLATYLANQDHSGNDVSRELSYSSEEFGKEECKRRWVDSTSVSDCSDSKIGQTDAIDNMGRSLLGDYVMTEHPIEYQLQRSEFQDCDSDSSTFSNDCQGNLWFVVVITTVGSGLKWIFMTAKMLCSPFLKIVMSLFFKP